MFEVVIILLAILIAAIVWCQTPYDEVYRYKSQFDIYTEGVLADYISYDKREINIEDQIKLNKNEILIIIAAHHMNTINVAWELEIKTTHTTKNIIPSHNEHKFWHEIISPNRNDKDSIYIPGQFSIAHKIWFERDYIIPKLFIVTVK